MPVLLRTTISRTDIKQIRDKPMHTLSKEDKNLGQFFHKKDTNTSLCNIFTKNKMGKAKIESRKYLVNEIEKIKKHIVDELRSPEKIENILEKISDFFTDLDRDFFYNRSVNFFDEKRRNFIIFMEKELGNYIHEIDLHSIMECGILLSYHQNEIFDTIRDFFVSFFKNETYRTTKNIELLKREITVKSADEKLLIAIKNNSNIEKYGVNKFDLIRQALREGATIKSKEYYRVETSFFHIAVRDNLVEIVKEFIIHKICMDELTQKEFFKEFHEVITSGYEEIEIIEMVKELLKYNNEISLEDSLDETGKNLLHRAVCSNRTVIAQLLFNTKKINIEAVDILGNTALHYAALTGNTELISMLMNSGADAYALNNALKTPIDIAESRLRSVNNFREVNDFIHTKLKTKTIEERKTWGPILTNSELKIKGIHDIIQDYIYSRPNETIITEIQTDDNEV